MTPATRTTTTPVEALVVTAICFGMSIVLSLQAVAAGFPAGSFDDSGFVGLIKLELAMAGAAVLFLALRGYAVSTLLPRPSLRGCGEGLLVYLAASAVAWLLLLPFASAWQEQPIEQMMAQATVSVPTVLALAVVNGTFEEVFLLGFLSRGLRGHGLSVALGVPLLVRVLYHLYQGPAGALAICGFGLVLSVCHARSGRLWPVVFAHMLADVVPFVMA